MTTESSVNMCAWPLSNYRH